MPTPDLVIEARAYVRGEFDDVELGLDLDAGTILTLKKTHSPGLPRHRFPGKILVPSAVDLHVHLRDPGEPKKETFATGTRGAALGGVGTVLDMPNTRPLVDRHGRLQEKADHVRGRAHVDWGLWATLTPQTPDPARLLAAAHGVKLYLAPTTGIDAPPAPQHVRAALRHAHDADRIVALHAEGPPAPGPARDLAHHDHRSPVAAEAAAVHAAAQAAPDPRDLHVAHATAPAVLDAAHAHGVTAGATPHHLLLSHDEGHLGPFGRVNPPLRDHATRTALWDALAHGAVDLIETDHAPHTLDEKRRPFPEAPSGIPSLQTAYPMLLHHARTHGLPPARIVDAYAAAPAARLGLAKGSLEPGHDADFVVLDPRRTVPIRADRLESPAGWTPYEGRPMLPVEAHWLHGHPVVEDGHSVARPGTGRRLPLPSARHARAALERRRAPPPPADHAPSSPKAP